MHLSCTQIKTISKHIKISFRFIHVILEYNQVHPKWFLSLWDIWCNSCIYLALRLHYLQMLQNEFPLDPRHVGIPSVVLKWFLNQWYVRRKPCTYLASRLTLSPNRLKWSSTWSTPPRSTIWCAQSDFRAYGTFGANSAPIWPRD
jgi:hypothetical protein